VSDRVLVQVDGGVLTATLNRADKRNAIDTAMIDALLAALERADLDAGVRVVAVRGAGRDFCAGMDLNELLASADHTLEENRQAALQFAEIFVRMRRLPKPVVRRGAGGVRSAGGCGLATACDLILAAESAQFGYPEVQRGFVTRDRHDDAAAERWAKRSLSTWQRPDGCWTARRRPRSGSRRASTRTLISRSRPAEVLRVLAEASPSALASPSSSSISSDGLTFDEGLRLGADVNAVSRSTPDFRAALSAFLKK